MTLLTAPYDIHFDPDEWSLLNDPDGKTPVVAIDVDVLLETGLFVQSNSGGGKSRLLRRVTEQVWGKTQQILFDPEGEFHTLREKFGFLYAAPKGGDCVATPDTAHKLMRRTLEVGSSMIVDINDLSPPDRLVFMHKAITSIMTAPRDLWHGCLIGIDEIQKFAPQDYETKAERECRTAIIDLAGQGRKRGYRLIAVTQRISAVAKGVLAELNNYALGRTSLDVDIKRARSVLGMSAQKAEETLPHLSPGTFFVVGPALAPVVTQVRTGEVVTTHPRSGSRRAAPTPTPASVKAMLKQFADLPAEAAKDESDVETLRARVRELEFAAINNAATIHALRSSDSVRQNAAELERLRKLTDEYRRDLANALAQLHATEKENEVLTGVVEQMTETLDAVCARTNTLIDKIMDEIHGPLVDLRNKYTNDLQDLVEHDSDVDDGQRGTRERTTSAPHATQQGATTPGQRNGAAAGNVAESHRAPVGHRSAEMSSTSNPSDDEIMPVRVRRFLTVLAQHGALPKKKILLFGGYASSGKTTEAFAMMIRNGWATGGAHIMEITDKGREVIGPIESLPTGRNLRVSILNSLKTTRAKKIFATVCDAYPNAIAKKEILERVGYASSGKTTEVFAHLVARSWVLSAGPSLLKASPTLFE